MSNGTLHITTPRHVPILRRDIWREGGTRTITDLDPEAVARLNAFHRGQPPPPPPQEPAPMPEPPAVPSINITMADYTGRNRTEHGAFIRRHFPAWLAYQAQHNIPAIEMMALVGITKYPWYKHAKNIKITPHLYGPNPTK